MNDPDHSMEQIQCVQDEAIIVSAFVNDVVDSSEEEEEDEEKNIILNSTTADAIDAVSESLAPFSPTSSSSSLTTHSVATPLSCSMSEIVANNQFSLNDESSANEGTNNNSNQNESAKKVKFEIPNTSTMSTENTSPNKPRHKRAASIKDYKMNIKVFKMLGSKDNKEIDLDNEDENTSDVNDRPLTTLGRLSKIAARRLAKPIKVISTSLLGGSNNSTQQSQLSTSTSSVNDTSVIPQLIKDCCSFLKQYGLKEEGLFRISGSSERVEALMLAYQTASNNGEKESADIMHILKKHSTTIHETATLFKYYLQNVMDPLVDTETRTDLLEIVETKKKKGANVRRTIFEIIARLLRLPLRNKIILQYILEFLEHVAKHELENKMTTTNLSRVFAPILLRDNSVQIQSPQFPMKLSASSTTTSAEDIMQTLPKLIFISEVMIANHRALSL